MFKCKFAPLSVNPSTKLYQKVQGLCLFSEACERIGVHPAQGMRIANRHFIKDKYELQVNPSADSANTLAARIHKQLQPKPQQVASITPRHPEHFLLQTNMPTNILSAEGYISPVQNIFPDVHFIRTQRRYNKRRYARVRAVSRPSFGSGMMLSTVATGAFGGSTIQGTDGLTVGPISPDPTLLLMAGFLILIRKFGKLSQRASTPHYREFNLARQGGTHHLPLF